MARPRTAKRAERGMVVTEFALVMPMLLLLLVLLVETGNALKVYYTLFEASREAARLVLSQGDADDVSRLVESLTSDLPKTSLQNVVKQDSKKKTVSVELVYAYQPLFSKELLDSFGWSLPTLRAVTTMPMP